DVTFTPQFDADQPQVVRHPLILGVAAGSPAAEGGMLPGDLVVEINGEPISSFAELRDRTQASLGEAMSLTLLRCAATLEVSVPPRATPPAGEGAMGVSLPEEPVGVDQGTGLVYQEGPAREIVRPQPLGAAVQFALARTGDVLATIVR